MEMAFLKVDCARRHSNFPQGRKTGRGEMREASRIG